MTGREATDQQSLQVAVRLLPFMCQSAILSDHASQPYRLPVVTRVLLASLRCG